jgi:molybdopterin molybdotransferase
MPTASGRAISYGYPHDEARSWDGWAVACEGPWQLDGVVRMGHAPDHPLAAGKARAVATGGALPPGATAVLRSENSRLTGEHVHIDGAEQLLPVFADIRRAGEEFHACDVLVEAGVRVTPAVASVATVAGVRAVTVVTRPRVALVVLGDEIVHDRVPGPGQAGDAFGASIPMILSGLGADIASVEYVADALAPVRDALGQGNIDLVISTGGTAHGQGDHVMSALCGLGAATVVDGVAMRPGHPVILARRPDGVPVLGLPGNPFAAFVALVALGMPLFAGLVGAAMPQLLSRHAARPLSGTPSGVRLIAVMETCDGIEPVRRQAPGMVSGLVRADGIAVAGVAGVEAGSVCNVLPLPWAR